LNINHLHGLTIWRTSVSWLWSFCS